MDGDGRDDAIVVNTMTQQGTNPDDFKLFIFHQTPGGVLADPVTVPYSSTAIEGDHANGARVQTAINATDLDGDGISDIVVGQRGGFALVMGRRDRAYVARRIANPMGTSGDSFGFLDADRDGHVDIASQNESSGDPRWGLSIFFGDPSNSYNRRIFIPTSNDGDIELRIGDLNSDGIQDIATAFGQGLSQRVEIRHGNGIGGFSDPAIVPKPAELVLINTIAVADFSGADGRDDLVIAGWDKTFVGGLFFLYKQTGGALQAIASRLPSVPPTDSAWNPDKALPADMNMDGKADLVVLRSGGYLSYYENRGGELITEKYFAGPYQTFGGLTPISVGDLNGDGCRDVAISNNNYGLVVWHGKGCSNSTP